MRTLFAVVLVLGICSRAWSQTTRPTTRPATQPATVDPNAMINQLLTPSRPTVKPLQPLPDPPAIDRTSGAATVAPRAPTLHLIREGTYRFDRAGRLTKTPDGQYEFIFDSDGQAMQDPPMVVLPNLTLMSMESFIKTSGRELRFRITGMITEYRDRNYILLDKAVVVPEK
jgi:hypothetical protein